jgi:SET domain-containing protein
MGHSFLCDKVEVRAAGRKGLGVFAIESIAAGETVAAFGGSVVSKAEFDQMPELRRVHGIQIDDELFMVGGETLEPADYANHSCAPNAGIVGSILLVAMTEIAPGEEVCFDYAMCDASDYDEFVCECGTERCRRVVTSADWQLDELQDRYAGWMSAYLQRRIAADLR